MARKKFNVQQKLTTAAGLGAGSIAANMVASKLPFGDDRIKSGVPIVLGLILADKKGILGDLGKGMAAAGVSKLASNFGIGYIPENILGNVDIDFEPNAMAGSGHGVEMDF
jgi:hypothetical protein